VQHPASAAKGKGSPYLEDFLRTISKQKGLFNPGSSKVKDFGERRALSGRLRKKTLSSSCAIQSKKKLYLSSLEHL